MMSTEDEPAAKRRAIEEDLHSLRAAERRMQRDLSLIRRRESSLVLRLAVKERENTEMQQKIHELQQALQPSQTHETTLLLDPAVNAEIMRLRAELQEAKKKEKEAQDELQASQYSSSSINGKKLMNKLKEVQGENDQIAKDMQKMRADSALQKQYAGELHKALSETREWVEHLSEELDTSQAIALSVRRELNATKSKLAAAEAS